MKIKKLIVTGLLTATLLIPNIALAGGPVVAKVKVPKTQCTAGVCCTVIDTGSYSGPFCTWFRSYEGKTVTVRGNATDNGFVYWKWGK